MPRLWNPGVDREGNPLRPPLIKHPTLGDCIAKPLLFCPHDKDGNAIPQYLPAKPGSACFGLHGYGFWVIGPGESVDLDPGIPVSSLKSEAPALMSDEEWQEKDKPKPAPAEAAAPAVSAEEVEFQENALKTSQDGPSMARRGRPPKEKEGT